MYKRLFSAALVFGAAALAPPVDAQVPRCLPRADLIETLEHKFNEHLTGGGLQNPQQLIELWTSPDSGSFTVFITKPDGVSCIMATGQYWNSSENPADEDVQG